MARGAVTHRGVFCLLSRLLKEIQENFAEAVMVNTRLKEEDKATVAKYENLVTETG